MQLKTVTWNIGGGKHLKEGEDPLLMASYSVDAISEIAEWLKLNNPDIITLQEVQGTETGNQVEDIAHLLGYEHYFFDAISSSHIDEGKSLGNGIISKYPIENHHNGAFLNPNLDAELQGRHLVSHDKGYSTCSIDFNGRLIRTTTLHLLPFRAFNIELESEVGQNILKSVSQAIGSPDSLLLIQGDFNIDSQRVKEKLPGLATEGLSEIQLEVATTPAGRKYDHILYKGFDLREMNIDAAVMTDHYPVMCQFHVNE